MKILVLFTFDYSLKSWNDSGTLSRELSIYKELNKKKSKTRPKQMVLDKPSKPITAKYSKIRVSFF